MGTNTGQDALLGECALRRSRVLRVNVVARAPREDEDCTRGQGARIPIGRSAVEVGSSTGFLSHRYANLFGHALERALRQSGESRRPTIRGYSG